MNRKQAEQHLRDTVMALDVTLIAILDVLRTDHPASAMKVAAQLQEGQRSQTHDPLMRGVISRLGEYAEVLTRPREPATEH